MKGHAFSGDTGKPALGLLGAEVCREEQIAIRLLAAGESKRHAIILAAGFGLLAPFGDQLVDKRDARFTVLARKGGVKSKHTPSAVGTAPASTRTSRYSPPLVLAFGEPLNRTVDVDSIVQSETPSFPVEVPPQRDQQLVRSGPTLCF